MKISVVTVCFNSAKTIERTLESFLRQDHPDKELLVIDGASTDETMNIVRAMASEDFIVVSEPDRGIFDAMNKGLARFSGDAVGYLNSDDCYHDTHVLSDIAAGLEVADIVFGDIRFVADHETQRVVRTWRSTPHRLGAFRKGWMAPHPSVYVRRDVAARVGAFDLSYPISSDYDWMLRAFELSGASTRRLPRIFVNMKIGGASTRDVSAYVKGNLEALRARRRWLASGLVDYALFAKPLGKLTQWVVPPAGGSGPG